MYDRPGMRVAEDCIMRGAETRARQSGQGVSRLFLILRSGVGSQAKLGLVALFARQT